MANEQTTRHRVIARGIEAARSHAMQAHAAAVLSQRHAAVAIMIIREIGAEFEKLTTMQKAVKPPGRSG